MPEGVVTSSALLVTGGVVISSDYFKTFVAGFRSFFGADTRDVLTSIAGMSDAEVDALYATGVSADAPVNPGIG